jgi:hypothetical protein
MIPLTPEQRIYKEKTVQQLVVNKGRLEASLVNESRERVLRSIQRQLADIEAHIGRLQDELSGTVVVDEPVADELFLKSAQALANGKFYLARRKITKLETIEPFYPGIDRLKREAESQQVSRRTRSIAEGKASGYPLSTSLPGMSPPAATAPAGVAALPAPVEPRYGEAVVEEENGGFFASFFQFHILVSCLVVVLLLCVVFGMAGMTIIQWLVEGGA